MCRRADEDAILLVKQHVRGRKSGDDLVENEV